ncbi:feruloyl-CoA synthase [Azospirillum sp. sgz301742]
MLTSTHDTTDAHGAAIFAPPQVTVEPRPDGGMVLRSPLDLGPCPRCLGDLLARWAERAPDRVFLAERQGDGWREVSYAAALAAVERIAQALVERGADRDRPVAILSDNGVDHALLMLAAMHVGVPVAPVSPAYSLMSKDFSKLRHILGELRPALIYVEDAAAFAGALGAVDRFGAAVFASRNGEAVPGALPFDALLAAEPDRRMRDANASVGPDTVAKILYTSGSTGLPKGVLNTQRMMCSNQEAMTLTWPFLAERPPVILDWLPWNHTFGGNHNFNMILRHGGTLYIDNGKPVPHLIGRTVENLRKVSPTIYFSVPRGFDMLLPILRGDRALQKSFFTRLELMFYAGAALPEHLWQGLQRLSLEATGRQVPLVSAWGCTETAPLATGLHFLTGHSGNIGLPVPGTEIKLVPSGGKQEIRVRGPNVTPGYFKRPDLTAAAFDQEGYYKTGDAVRLADPGDPAKGIRFDGRIAEDFKLMSGTWVHVGALRIAVLEAGAPVIQDAVVTGHDREEVGVLIFPNRPACLSLCPGADPDMPFADLLARPEVRAHVAAALRTLAGGGAGSSARVVRALLMEEPPSIDANEITDKGYINQRRVLERRADLVERLYADDDPAIIRLT